jgi:hypothetical protein
MATQAADELAYTQAAEKEFASDAEQDVAVMGALGPLLLAEFLQAEQDRGETERRWLSDLRQYKGKYAPDVLTQIGANRSKAFVRKTRVKVKTINSRVTDLLFPAGSEKNWSIDATPMPAIGKEQHKKLVELLTQANGGQAPDKAAIDKAVLASAKKSAEAMSLLISDQLSDSRYKRASVQAIHSAHLFGTGIIKGPLVERKVRTKFNFNEETKRWGPVSESYVTPFVDYVPLWRFYPDMAATCIEDCRYAYERHLMTRASLAELVKRKSFEGEKIKDYILTHPKGMIRSLTVDGELRSIGERDAIRADDNGQYEVLERWGWLDGVMLQEAGVEIPEKRLHESFFSNVWLLPNGTVIKAVLQPIDGVTWPYHLYHFDKDETSFFAEGLGSVMCDDQTMINAATRMALDNAAITSGCMLEVAPGLLSNMENVTEMHPWKIWMRNNTQPGTQAVRAVSLPSQLNELFQLVSMFEANSDEVTAIPRYMTGENATQGAAGTASGMSMLMGAANIVLKDLITNWDEGVTKPFLTALYRWNMQFHESNEPKGDFDVVARGTASLVAKEIRSKQLDEFANLADNPLDAPYIKRQQLLVQRAEAHELSDVVKTEEEMQAEQSGPDAQKAMQQQQELQQAQMAEQQAKVKKLIADAERILAQAGQIRAETISTKVAAAYAAMQAGGVATERPEIAPAGDEILRSAGWRDETPEQSVAPAPAGEQPAMDVPTLTPQTGGAGLHAGMETAAIE